MTVISKDSMAVLLIITIIISVFGTLTAVYTLMNYQGYEKVQEAPENLNLAEARVELNYAPELQKTKEPVPSFATADVSVELVDETQGG
jgi:flagellar basal body-associated protein FliL